MPFKSAWRAFTLLAAPVQMMLIAVILVIAIYMTVPALLPELIKLIEALKK